MTMGQLMGGQKPTWAKRATKETDDAVIIYTSGTTGRPKGAVLNHSNLILNAMICRDLFDTNSDDTQLIVLPLFHIFAMTCLMNAGVLVGAHNILLPRFEADVVFGLLEKHDVTIFAGVPTMYWGLLNYTEDKFNYKKIADTLRVCASGGAALPVQVLKDFETRFDVPILEGYGM